MNNSTNNNSNDNNQSSNIGSSNAASSAQEKSGRADVVVRGRKRARTSSVWDYFSQQQIGETVRYSCSVHNCKRHFSVRSSTSTLRGHLKDHGYFVDENQTRLTVTGSLCDKRPKPMEQRQHDFFLLCVIGLLMPVFRSRRLRMINSMRWFLVVTIN